jgi:hypothetical protein
MYEFSAQSGGAMARQAMIAGGMKPVDFSAFVEELARSSG